MKRFNFKAFNLADIACLISVWLIVVVCICVFSKKNSCNRLVDGRDWAFIHYMKLKPDEKTEVKLMALRVMAQTRVFSGERFNDGNNAYLEQMHFLDEYYKGHALTTLPIFYVIRIQELFSGGVTIDRLKLYANMINEQLKEKGLIKEP